MEMNNYLIKFMKYKKSGYLNIIFFITHIMLVSCNHEAPVDEYSKNEAVIDGNLQEAITYDNLRMIERLTIKGPIKDEDWNILYEMALTGKLSFLDMTEATIVGNPNSELYRENEIPSYLFSGSKTLQTVLLPKNLKGVGTAAFSACNKLNSISFPNSLQFIGDEAFTCCSKLTLLDLPQSIDSIGARAFYETPISGELILPQKLRVVAKQAFAYTNITNVIINHDVYAARDTKMYVINNNSVFASCKYLQKVVVEEGCTCLELGFTNCKSLTDLTLPSSLKYIGRDSRYTHNHIFERCTSLTNIKLPEGLLHIGISAFGSTSLQTLEIPKTVQYIGDYAFNNANIPIIKVHWDIPINISKRAFKSFDFNNSTLYIPKNASDLYHSHECWSLFGKIIEM